MRHSFRLTLCLLALLVLPACQPLANTEVSEESSVAMPAPADFHEGTPVSSPEQAVVAASFGVATTRLEALATPQAPVVEQLAHRVALERIGHRGDAENPAYPDDLDVWLVVFEGEWTLTPPMSSPQPPFHGCVFAIVSTAEGHAFHAGTCACSVCNPQKTSEPQ